MPSELLLRKVVLMGAEKTGKSAFLGWLNSRTIQPVYQPTIGVEFGIQTYQDKVKFQFWDTAGQERFQSITSSYWRGVDLAVIFYSDLESLKKAKTLHNEFRAERPDCPIVLLYNPYNADQKPDQASLEQRRQELFGSAYNLAFESIEDLRALSTEEALGMLARHVSLEPTPEERRRQQLDDGFEDLEVVSYPAKQHGSPGRSILNKKSMVGAGVACSVAAAALWIGLACGVFTPGVLGVSAMAAALIAVAFPAAVALTVVGVGTLLGVGIYSKCFRRSTVDAEALTDKWEDGASVVSLEPV